MEKKLSLVTLLVCSIHANFTIAENYKIAFGSCLDQENPQPIWNSIYKEDIDSYWDNWLNENEELIINEAIRLKEYVHTGNIESDKNAVIVEPRNHKCLEGPFAHFAKYKISKRYNSCNIF